VLLRKASTEARHPRHRTTPIQDGIGKKDVRESLNLYPGCEIAKERFGGGEGDFEGSIPGREDSGLGGGISKRRRHPHSAGRGGLREN